MGLLKQQEIEVVSRVDNEPVTISFLLSPTERLEETCTAAGCASVTPQVPCSLELRLFPSHTKQEQLSVLCIPLVTPVSSEEQLLPAPFSILPEHPPSTSAFISVLHSHRAVWHTKATLTGFSLQDAMIWQGCAVESSHSL